MVCQVPRYTSPNCPWPMQRLNDSISVGMTCRKPIIRHKVLTGDLRKEHYVTFEIKARSLSLYKQNHTLVLQYDYCLLVRS